MPYTGKQLEAAYSDLAARCSAEHAEIERSVAKFDEITASVAADREQCSIALAAVYVPELSEPCLAEAERKTGFRGFSRFHPIQAMRREEGVLDASVARVRLEENYIRREYLVGPHGSITRKLAEATDNLNNWQIDCDRFERLEGFLDLVNAGYDTPEFEHRWWTPTYWWQWATGDRICATLGVNDFGDDVLPAYRKVQAPRDQWRGEVSRITAERDAVLALVKKHDDDLLRRQNLASIYLDECRKALAAHLRTADPQLLREWSDQDRGLVVLLQQLSGLGAKAEYTRDMKARLTESATALRQRQDAAIVKARKLARPKKQWMEFPDSAYPHKALGALPKLRARREKTLAMADKIRRYDDYDGFDLGNDPALWWFAMTGRAPGAYNPGLQGWYDRNPSRTVVWVEAARDEHLHATAVHDTHHDALGDLS